MRIEVTFALSLAMGFFHYSYISTPVIPEVIRLWKIKIKMIAGIVVTIAAAIDWEVKVLPKKATATVTVRALGSMAVKVKAKRNSFQALMKANSPVVTRAGALKGSKIIWNVWNGVAPSTCAACIISEGRPLKKAVNTQTLKGRVKSKYDRIMLGIADIRKRRAIV